MKKTFLLFAILVTGLITNAFGQDPIVLTFMAQNNEQSVPLDSILIVNLTQEVDTMLYSPDTVFVLQPDSISTPIFEQGETNRFSVSSNYPNPFNGNTNIDVYIDRTDKIRIRVFDLLGREHISLESALDAGKHTFAFYPGKANFYIFSVFYDGFVKSIKIANPLSERQDCKLVHQGFEEKAGNHKAHPYDNFPFSIGDEMRYIGYSETTSGVRGAAAIEDIPEEDTLYLFEITEGIPCADNPTVFYQYRFYNTVQIGTQCWLKESLNIGTMINGIHTQTDNGTLEKYCFDDNLDNCETHGGLYQWREAMKYATEEGAQGICPQGWHIPTDEQWKQLEGEVDSQYGYPNPEWDKLGYRGHDIGKRLKTQNGWNNNNGSNLFGFSALATGTRRFDGVFLNMGSYSGIWSSTSGSEQGAWYRYMEGYSQQVARTHNTNEMGRPVRCIKD